MTQTRNTKALLIALVIIAIDVGFLFLPVRQWFLQLQGQIESLDAPVKAMGLLATTAVPVLATRAALKAMAQVGRRNDEPDGDLKVSEAQ